MIYEIPAETHTGSMPTLKGQRPSPDQRIGAPLAGPRHNCMNHIDGAASVSQSRGIRERFGSTVIEGVSRLNHGGVTVCSNCTM